MRFDLQVVASWIEQGSKVLDLGCGEGVLLEYLTREKGVRAAGIEQSETKVAECLSKGLSVLHGDVNEDILDYPDGAFDYVILSQTLQQVFDPARLIDEMLRIGVKGIVSFPNFSHWGIRLQLLLGGRTPVSKELPYDWHDTPNIRVITIKDFRRFCREHGFAILSEVATRTPHHEEHGKLVRLAPNLRAIYGVFLLGRE
ncbi:MAG: methionine biosynthesis protein MetW [Desulfovibrionaceae bacterium]